jgi:predicted ATP-dependent endonuclease of OLD family
MHISKSHIKNDRDLHEMELPICDGVTCVLEEPNSGKSNLGRGLRYALDAQVFAAKRNLEGHDFDVHCDIAQGRALTEQVGEARLAEARRLAALELHYQAEQKT